jgi:hypothetical protein
MSSIIVSENLQFLTASQGIRSQDVTFLDLLEILGLTKQELAHQLGKVPESVSRWGNDPPVYAVAYLEKCVETEVLRARLLARDGHQDVDEAG